MTSKKARDLKIQVAEGIKVLEASVTVVRAEDYVARIKTGDSLEQNVNTSIPLTPELIEDIAKKVRDILNEQSSVVAASGDSQFERFATQGIDPRLIAATTTASTLSLNSLYLGGQKDKTIIIYNFKDIKISQKAELYKNQSTITEEDIKKFTPAQLSFGALLWILGFLAMIIVVSFKFGYYYREITQSSVISKQTSSLEQLNSYQIALLKEIYNYQKIKEVKEIIITRAGFVVNEAINKNTSVNIATSVLGSRADQSRFEDLIISMPEFWLKRLPSARFDDPYVLTVTEEARKILDMKP